MPQGGLERARGLESPLFHFDPQLCQHRKSRLDLRKSLKPSLRLSFLSGIEEVMCVPGLAHGLPVPQPSKEGVALGASKVLTVL